MPNHDFDFSGLSGEWRGNYGQYGMDHEYSFLMTFSASSATSASVAGHGNDDVGLFTVSGEYHATSRQLFFEKKYQIGTGDPRENSGHVVECRGTVHGYGCRVVGVEGEWFIETHDRGRFRIWPVQVASCPVCNDRVR